MSTDNVPSGPVKYVAIDRSQLRLEPLDVESLIPLGHAARVIREVAGTLDLTAFEEQSKSREGRAGRPCWSARVLVSVWVYAYSIGTASARAIERLMEQEPGLRWLTGMQVINYHTLADFRVGHGEALKELFAQLLVAADAEGVVDLNTILHDGTKVRAVAGRGSYHRRKTLERGMRKARKVLQELDRRAEQELEAMDAKRAAAQRRAAHARQRGTSDRAESGTDRSLERGCLSGSRSL